MRNSKAIKIDSSKLRHAVNVRNMKLAETSTEMGFNAAYLNNAMARGYLAPAGAILLEKLFDIQPHEYQITEPTPEPEPVKAESEEAATQALDYVQLYNTVYAAMLAALKQNAKEMREHLFDKPSKGVSAS